MDKYWVAINQLGRAARSTAHPSSKILPSLAKCYTNQNPEDEWRRKALPLIFWVLCPKQKLHCDIWKCRH
ncbi:MAG: hypothetical protein DCF19_21505 [Pseudanabaena frigida]|uniref:Uncharacterized protein n=1 Tax=Pseudanabaena frigida TaxID=945775 RepID=A0A2W4W2S4_9CYAN|nr:MAG: hypothetical protein DCF19_21505 [Pseudanabaena frigida]